MTLTIPIEQVYGFYPIERVFGADSRLTKWYDEPIEVEVRRLQMTPVAFRWRGRRYSVQHLLKRWREAAEGWDPQSASDEECFRVEADGGTYELRLDRLAGRKQPQWRLARVWD
ncbi:MAG: DUF6504 family protein [Actinomycetota bacterium]